MSTFFNDNGDRVSPRSAHSGIVGVERRRKRLRPRGMSDEEYQRRLAEVLNVRFQQAKAFANRLLRKEQHR